MGKGDPAVNTARPQEASEPNPSNAGQMITVETSGSYQSATSQQMYQGVDSSAILVGANGRQVQFPRDMTLRQRGTLHMDNAHVMSLPIHTSYSDQNLPISAASASDTLVITDSNSTVYADAMSRSNMSLSLQYAKDHPNSEAPSNNVSAMSEPNSLSMDPTAYYSEPQMAYTPHSSSPGHFVQCPNGTGGNSGPVQSTGGGGASGQSSFVTGYAASQSCGRSLVTGVGGGNGLGGGGGGDEPWRPPVNNLPRAHYNDATVFVEEDADELLRRIIDAPGTADNDLPMGGLGLPDYTMFTEMDQFFPNSDCLPEMSATTPADPSQGYYANFEGASIQPMEESGGKRRGSIGEQFDILKMMKKPYKPINLGLAPPTPATSHSATNQMSQPITDDSIFMYDESPSPAVVQSPHVPIQVSNPSPRTPPAQFPPNHTPSPVVEATPTEVPPTPAEQRPFDTNTFIEDGIRYCELRARQHLPAEQSLITHKALFFSYSMAMQFEECLKQDNDLKVANDLCAELCGYQFVSEEKKIVFTMPAGCVPLAQWLEEKGNSIDLRERQFVLQQILNTLAKVHTIGTREKLNFWGSFMVWVSPEMKVYILLDFIVMLGKMEKFSSAQSFNFDPRSEDIRAAWELYQQIVRPFVDRDANWVSPGVKQLMCDFEKVLMDHSSVYRMAEVARMFGERRMCRLEVDVMSLDVTIFCVEHELLFRALQPLQNLVPSDNDWVIQWVNSGRIVTRTDLATADRRMQIRVVQSPYLPHNHGVTLQQN